MRAEHRHVVIVLGGHRPHEAVVSLLDPSDTVVCADSGLDHAYSLGLQPDVVIGDFDSVSSAALERARTAGVTELNFPPDKDRTDAELALHHALESGATRVTVVWGGGDRIDHVLGVFAALAHPLLARLRSLEVWMGGDHLRVLHAAVDVAIDLRPGATVSLVPLGATDVRLSSAGLRWDLDDEVLHGHAARGVSNEVLATPVRITVTHGVVGVVTPDGASNAGRIP